MPVHYTPGPLKSLVRILAAHFDKPIVIVMIGTEEDQEVHVHTRVPAQTRAVPRLLRDLADELEEGMRK